VGESTVFPSREFCPGTVEALAKIGTISLPCPPPAAGKLFIGINPEFNPEFPWASPEFFLRLVQTVSPKQVITRILALDELRGLSVPASESQNRESPRTFVTVTQIAAEIQDRQSKLKAAQVQLQLLPSVNDPSELPSKGKSLIVLARLHNLLRFRIFDNDGDKIVDTDETQLPAKSQAIQKIKSMIVPAWDGTKLGGQAEAAVIAAVTSIFCQCPDLCPGAYEVCLHDDVVIHVRESAPILVKVESEFGLTAEVSAESLHFVPPVSPCGQCCFCPREGRQSALP
jgi:hypothetical protein